MFAGLIFYTSPSEKQGKIVPRMIVETAIWNV